MGCYWDISGNIIAKKGSIEEVKEVLKNHGIDIDEVKGEKISFSYYEFAAYDMPDDLDSDLTPLVEDGEFTAKSDEDSRTSRYTYGEEPDCEESVVLEYYPSQIDDFVKTLPKDIVDAVIRAYAEPAANKDLKAKKNKDVLGSVISRVRTERGMTQRELAKKVEVSNSTISRIEKDDGIHPDPPTLKAIADVLSIDYNYLLALNGQIDDDADIRMIQRGAKNLSPEQRKKMMNMLNMMFDDVFTEEHSGGDT